MKQKNKILLLIAGNILPLLLLFLAPSLGIVDSTFLMFFITFLFLAHYYLLSKYIEDRRSLRKRSPDKIINTQYSKKVHIKQEIIIIKRFGFAFGITGSIIYMGHILLMITVGPKGAVLFFNSLLHGIDTSNIIRMQVPWWEALIGIAETFMISWLIGACIAAVYNISNRK